MTVTVLKTYFKQKEPTTVAHRNYANYFNDSPILLISDEFAKIQVCNEILALQNYFHICIKSADKCVLEKPQYFKENSSIFIDKTR